MFYYLRASEEMGTTGCSGQSELPGVSFGRRDGMMEAYDQIEGLIIYLQAHPLVALVLVVLGLMVLASLLKKLIKAAFIIAVIFLAGLYWTNMEAESEWQTQAEVLTKQATKLGKAALEKGKELFEEGKKKVEEEVGKRVEEKAEELEKKVEEAK